jgi:hypothetical protein
VWQIVRRTLFSAHARVAVIFDRERPSTCAVTKQVEAQCLKGEVKFRFAWGVGRFRMIADLTKPELISFSSRVYYKAARRSKPTGSSARPLCSAKIAISDSDASQNLAFWMQIDL